MEPVSAVVGVFSLAAEVASIAAKLKAVIASYRGAPSEAARLSDTLAFLEGICLAIDRELQRSSESATRASRGEMHSLIRSALEPCRAKLAEMDRSLAALGSGSDVKSRLKFAYGKDAIKEMNGDLDRLVSRLQFSIGADVWICRLDTVTNAPGVGLCDNHVARYSSTAAPLPRSSVGAPTSAELTPGSVRPVVSRTTQQIQWYRGFLGQVEQKKTMKRTRWPEAFDRGVVDEHTVVSLSTPWLPYRLGLELRKTASTTLSYALNITHIIDLESPLGQKLHSIFIGFGKNETAKLRQLQYSLSNGELSLYSVIRLRSGREQTLLQRAINCKLPLFCAFLFDNDPQGRMLQETDPTRLEFSWGATDAQDKAADKIISRYFTAKQDILVVDAFTFLSNIFSDPASLLWTFRHLLPYSGHDSAEFIKLAWSISAIRYVTVLDFDPIHPDQSRRLALRRSLWYPLFRKLIRSGADVHGGRAYYRILDRQKCPFQVVDDVREWLSMLMNCGVDIPSYLQRERYEVFQTWDINRDFYDRHLLCWRGLTTMDFLGYDAPVWIRITDPSSHAAEVLGEFINVGGDLFHWDMSVIGGLDEWDYERLQSEEWPLVRSFKTIAAWCMEEANTNGWPSDYRKEIRRMLDAHERRLEMRWAKRGRKTKGARVAMPGAWVD
ncbi:hypothetical protein GGTG_08420 [Gaeumannomyces tritici R3-111a-1]|uniref:Fungal N-terminal domain-containing protein n=1 Tax=Gaeumannomyces tritici (strain R3-111a-1) TaxID=644352 RepID=J3P4I3_GAET3|nr:hypothetical protein GGTG_08420 [Gaeumannomyces tritici R3-111a-1]EJT74580.1 hypothetical protein GGTG_08420 [Gaeumannomyces tritici R3-111a-1]